MFLFGKEIKETPLQFKMSRSVKAGSCLIENRRVYKYPEEDKVYAGSNKRNSCLVAVVADGASKSGKPEFMAAHLVAAVYEVGDPSLSGLKRAVDLAHKRAVEGVGRQDSASTITAMAMSPDKKIAHILQIGDSRAYLLRDSQLFQLTGDHDEFHDRVRQLEKQGLSFKQAWSQAKDEGKRENRLARVVDTVSSKPDIADYFDVAVKRGDVLLLCSDGLSKAIPDGRELSRMVDRSCQETDPAEFLVNEAEKKSIKLGKKMIDDIGVAMVRVE